ncbi:MAG: cupin domain-containing protein [Haloarculaceae archaeon]
MPDRVSLDDVTTAPHANLFPDAEPRTIRLALDAGERVDPHTHPDRQIVLFLRSGALELTLDEETYDLDPGDVIRFDGRREVSPRAVADSEALLVLAERVE